MTDKELLELAAKAAGIRLEWDGDPASWQPMYYQGKTYHAWNPLEDDGAALRLAVKLGLQVVASREKFIQAIHHASWAYGQCARDPDPVAATRRAIVRCAAEIGKAMGQPQKASEG